MWNTAWPWQKRRRKYAKRCAPDPDPSRPPVSTASSFQTGASPRGNPLTTFRQELVTGRVVAERAGNATGSLQVLTGLDPDVLEYLCGVVMDDDQLLPEEDLVETVAPLLTVLPSSFLQAGSRF